jgi:amidase
MRRLLLVMSLLLSLVSNAQQAVEVTEASLSELQAALAAGQTTSVALVDAYLARIEAYDQQGPHLNSIVRINPQARAQAASLDAERARSGPRSLLHGIPIVLKDNYNTVFMPTTGASVALGGFIPSANATQVDRLIAAGAIILAKTNLHEYAYGITSIGSLLGQTRNPYDIRRVPGGSSGGTAAAIAASLAAIGMGSDTCGSIRIPAAFNNLVGLRPSKGLSSIYGIIPLSHTQDVGGPLARSTEDLAILLDIVAGYDSNDPATLVMRDAEPPEFLARLDDADLSGMRIGKLSAYMTAADAAVRREIESALDWYADQGVEIVDIEIPELATLIGRSGVIGHEFRVDLDQYLALFLSADVSNLNDIVDLGLYHEAVQGALVRSREAVLNGDAYATALAARDELRATVERIMSDNELDAIAYPPIAEPPVFLGENQPGNNCSLAANAGLPALSLPVGFTNSGLPVGMELLGPFLGDARLLAFGHAFEQARNARRAPATTPPLVDGRAPGPQRSALQFEESGLQLQLETSLDVTVNRLDYTINVTEGADKLFAATLIIDGAAFELTDAVVENLIGPGRRQAAGSIFLSPALREALQEQRVYLKVFAETLPVAGVTRQLP